MSLIFNGIEPNNVIWNGIETTGIYNGETLWGSQPYYNLTLQTDGHGTLTASVLTGYPGDTITLSPTYNTYYRFNNYSVTGGTIANNTFTFGNENATAQANFKVNYFTATGNFEKGSNVNCWAGNTGNKWVYANVPAKYALHQNHTGDIPTSWYNTSNRWKPNNASAYSITLNTKMKFTGENKYNGTAAVTAVSLYGSTQTQSQSFSRGPATGASTWDYNKTFTVTNQNVNYGVSAYLGAYRAMKSDRTAQATYIATGTNGTWTATGIAP